MAVVREIEHICGHKKERVLKAFSPYTRRFESIQDNSYLRQLSPPKAVLRALDQTEALIQSVIDYWSKKPCVECYKGEAYQERLM